MALIGSVNNQGSLQGQINDANGYLTGYISSAELMGGQVVGMRGLKGDKGDKGDTGDTGNGISSISKTGASGKTDTYTILYTNGNSSTFTVTNGNDGTNGVDGYSPTATVSKSGSTATITITDKNGTTTAQVYDGSNGGVVTVHLYFDGDEYWADASLSYILDNIRNDKEVVLKFEETIYPFLSAPDTDVCYFGLCWAKDSDTISAELIEFTPSIIARSIYEYNIFSGDYDDLTNKPTIHDIPSGGYYGQVITKNSSTDYDIGWGYPKGRVWLGSSSTSSIEQTKIVTTLDEDYLPNSGDLLVVFFNEKNTYIGNYINLQVDDAPAITALSGRPDRSFGYGDWGDGAFVIFSYNNGYFFMVNSTPATTSNFGVTMLTNTISDNEYYALTPKAVYDAGYLTSAHEVPSGGSAGQVLAKNTNTDYDLTWITPSGGGGGTTDYSELVNKPSINSVTLSGNLSASDLSLASASHTHTVSDVTDFPSLASVATTGNYNDLTSTPTIPSKVSELSNDSGFLTTESDPIFTSSPAYGISASDITAWNNKSDFSGNYNDLTSKPTIPSKVSELSNDSGFITSGDVPQEVYWATYNSTTSANIESAYQANKVVCVLYQSKVYTLRYRNSSTDHRFICNYGDTEYRLKCASNVWSTETTTFVKTTRTINGKALSNDITLSASDVNALPSTTAIPSKVSDLSNDSGFITTETDPTVPSWAKAVSKPSYSFSELQSTPTTLSGYGITDAKIASGTITLGSNTITPLTSFTESDPIFTSSPAYSISASDISNWNGKNTVSVSRYTTSGTNIADLTIDGSTTKLYAPTSGGGGGGTLVQLVRW